MEAGTPRLTRATNRRKPPQNQQTHRDIHEDFTDKDEEQNILSTHLHRRDTMQAWTSGAHHYYWQTTVYYKNQTPLRPVDQTIKTRLTRYESDSSSEDNYNDHSYVSGYKDTSDHATTVPFHSHRAGNLNIGLRSIKPVKRRPRS